MMSSGMAMTVASFTMRLMYPFAISIADSMSELYRSFEMRAAVNA